MQLVLVLTHQCDLACTYCYAGPKDARRMPRAVGERAIERALLAVPSGGTLHLGLFGGEPLLAWDLGRALIRYASARAAARGVRVEAALTSNGTHLDERTLDELLELDVQVTISMDGLPAVHDAVRPRRGGQPSSGAALAAIDRLVARGVPVKVISVVRPESLDELAAGARFLAARGVSTLVHSLDHSAAWLPSDGPRLARAVAGLRAVWVERFPALQVAWLEGKAALLLDPALGKPACGVGQREIAVAPSGRLYPCERLVGDDAPGPFQAGHVDDDAGPLRLTRAFRARPGAAAACGDCAAEPWCSNACACANLARTGAMDGPDGLICALEQACAREAQRGLAELAGRRARRPLPLAGVA